MILIIAAALSFVGGVMLGYGAGRFRAGKRRPAAASPAAQDSPPALTMLYPEDSPFVKTRVVSGEEAERLVRSLLHDEYTRRHQEWKARMVAPLVSLGVAIALLLWAAAEGLLK